MYNTVHKRFWGDTAGWPADERWLALYLLTCSHRRSEGLFEWTPAYATAELDWPAPRVAAALAGLEARGWARYDRQVSLVLVVNALRWNPPKNPNQRVHVARYVRSLAPKSSVVAAFLAQAQAWDPELAVLLEDFNGSATVPEPFRNRIETSSSSSNSYSTAKDPDLRSVSVVEADAPTADPADEEARTLTELMSQRVRARRGIAPQSRERAVTPAGIYAARCMITIDSIPADHIRAGIEWVTKHHYWGNRVQSMTRLRSEWQQVVKEAEKQKRTGPRSSKAEDQLRSIQEWAAKKGASE